MDEEKSTQLISDLQVENLKEAAQSLKNKTKVQDVTGGTLFKSGDLQNGFYFFISKNKNTVDYFVRYKEISANGFELGRQILVWRDEDGIYTAGLAKFVFKNILLKKFNALCADQQQSNEDKRFWFNRLTESLSEKDKNVYFLDRRSTPNTLTQIHRIEELDSLKDVLWGLSEGHKRTHAVISSVNLKLMPKHIRKTDDRR